uniref:Arginosuccinate synthase-like N-terminal domain-containing protein n=1 Tax=Nelumbo nucifera TaxID=4432 RepID=A0A822YMJ5_NELNU|nr:TPA_asm: hypothetical protein HUJ06_012681 [Nelumbo nucifera]
MSIQQLCIPCLQEIRFVSGQTMLPREVIFIPRDTQYLSGFILFCLLSVFSPSNEFYLFSKKKKLGVRSSGLHGSALVHHRGNLAQASTGRAIQAVLSSEKETDVSTSPKGGLRGRLNKVVLAYSGGLDTSVIVPWLRENYGCEVVCFTADVGQVRFMCD